MVSPHETCRRKARTNIFDLFAPFRGQHNPLRGGWTAEQLQVASQALGVTDPAIAMVACSLVAEKRTTGTSLRYSRSQKAYKNFDAYEADPLMTYRRIVPTVDWLIINGYAEGHIGVWDFKKQSIIRATEKLMDLIGDLVDVAERQGAMLKDEIVLRDKNHQTIGFGDTDEIRRMRQELKTINAHLASQRYVFKGVEMYIPPAVRIFNQNFRRGGRLYHQGSSYHQMSKDKRAQIEMVLDDGTISPMVELDYVAHHLTLLYKLAGKTMPHSGLYEVAGFTRRLVKVATLISINADGNDVEAISKVIRDDEELAMENGIGDRSPSMVTPVVVRLLAAIRRKHYRIAEFFGTGAGAELMKADSDMAVKVMLSMIEKTGRSPLVVHDSFLVPVCDADELKSVMDQVLQSFQSSPETKSPLPPYHSGKHAFDQVERRSPEKDQKSLESHKNSAVTTTETDTGPPTKKWSSQPWEIRRSKVFTRLDEMNRAAPEYR